MTRQQEELSIIESIEMFYNSGRMYQALSYKTPNGFEQNYYDAEIVLSSMKSTTGN